MPGTKSSTVSAGGSPHLRTAVASSQLDARPNSGPGSRGDRRKNAAPRPVVPGPIAPGAPRLANAEAVEGFSVAAYAADLERALRLIAARGQNARRIANPAVLADAPHADLEAAPLDVHPNVIHRLPPVAAAVHPQLAPQVANPAAPGAAARPQNVAPQAPPYVPIHGNAPPPQYAQLARQQLGPLDIYGQAVDNAEWQQILIEQQMYNYYRARDLDHQEANQRNFAQYLQRQEANLRLQRANVPAAAANLDQPQGLAGQPVRGRVPDGYDLIWQPIIVRRQPQPQEGPAPRQQVVRHLSLGEHQQAVRQAVEKERQAGKERMEMARTESYQQGRADAYKEIIDGGRGGMQLDRGELGGALKEE